MKELKRLWYKSHKVDTKLQLLRRKKYLDDLRIKSGQINDKELTEKIIALPQDFIVTPSTRRFLKYRSTSFHNASSFKKNSNLEKIVKKNLLDKWKPEDINIYFDRDFRGLIIPDFDSAALKVIEVCNNEEISI